jgi:hypothetical protein
MPSFARDESDDDDRYKMAGGLGAGLGGGGRSGSREPSRERSRSRERTRGGDGGASYKYADLDPKSYSRKPDPSYRYEYEKVEQRGPPGARYAPSKESDTEDSDEESDHDPRSRGGAGRTARFAEPESADEKGRRKYYGEEAQKPTYEREREIEIEKTYRSETKYKVERARSPQPSPKPRYAVAEPGGRDRGNPKYYDSDSDSDDDKPRDRSINIELEIKHKDSNPVTVRKWGGKKRDDSPDKTVAIIKQTTSSKYEDEEYGRYARPERYEYAKPDERISYSKRSESYTASAPERPRYETRVSYGDPERRADPVPAPTSRYSESTKITTENGDKKKVVTVEPGAGRGRSGTMTLTVAGPAAMAGAPGSPMLEAYKGTYQSIGSLPSPLMRASKTTKIGDVDVDVLDIGGPDSLPSKARRARFHDLEADAAKLKAALRENKKKSYPDPQAFIDVLPPLSHEQILDLRTEYKKQVKTPDMKGVNVAKHIKIRLKEDKNFLKACYATALGRWEGEAYWANSYYQGDKVGRELLIESLFGRTNAEIRKIKESFRDKKYSDSLVKCLKTELKEDKFKRAVLLVLEERRMEEHERVDRTLVEEDARALYRAVRSEKGGETVMYQICILRSDKHLKEVLRVYEASFRGNFAREMLRKCGNLVVSLLTSQRLVGSLC